jgi:hypothetical protein
MRRLCHVFVWVCVRVEGEGDDAGFQLFFLRAPLVVLGGTRHCFPRARKSIHRQVC